MVDTIEAEPQLDVLIGRAQVARIEQNLAPVPSNMLAIQRSRFHTILAQPYTAGAPS